MLIGIPEIGKVWSGNDGERVTTEQTRPGRKQRIETLGFSLETDDACGSLRVRDYERQLEIRSKQMDCENTFSLSLPSLPPLSLSLFLCVCVRSSLFPFLSSSLALHAQYSPGGNYKRLGPIDAQIFLYLYRIRDIPLSSRKAQSEYR